MALGNAPWSFSQWAVCRGYTLWTYSHVETTQERWKFV